jgi:hypothetical protein
LDDVDSEMPSDFRRMAIMSEAALAPPAYDLKKNVLKGPFPSLEAYLKTHFDLLLQVFMNESPFRPKKFSGKFSS